MLKLVDDVLANPPAALREACSCRGILAGLETVGAFDVPTLRTLLEQDYAEVKQSISGAALPAFVARERGRAPAPDVSCARHARSALPALAAGRVCRCVAFGLLLWQAMQIRS